MANERYGNKYVVLLGHETSYGTKQTAPTATIYCSCVMKETTNQIETNIKTGDTEQWKNDVLAGTKSGTVTLSGELSLEDTSSAPTGYGALLAAFFSDAAGGTFGAGNYTTSGGAESFTIYQYFTAGTAKYDHAIGCVPESLEITGSSGEAITFNMTFRAKDITRETTDATPNDLTATTTYSDTTPLLFQNATLDKCLGNTGNLTTMNSFTLTFNKSYADDNLIYNNAQTKNREILCRFNGNLTVELNYNDAHSSDIYNNIMSSSLKTGWIKLNDSSGSNWKFVTNGKVTDYDRPDPDRCIFTNSYTKKLMGDKSGPTDAIKISYSA